ncbi:MAG: acyl-CoA/acyl-ACP dehydrogenase [Chloroflexi bacterium]|nr:acyl-CoA/acyl-ACP dehydrogenase [Chloroflexota bacterium]
MNLGFTESQEMLKKSAREFLERECPHTFVREMEEDERGYTPELWKKMADLGWLGLAFPEQYEGTGGNFLDLCVLLEETGRSLLPGPFFSDIVLGGLTVLDAGSEQQKRYLLPKIARGESIVALALNEPSARWDAEGIQDVKATVSNGQYVINGTKLFVQNANVSDSLIVVARTRRGRDTEKGITLFFTPARGEGISQALLRTIASDKQSEVTFQNLRVPSEWVLGSLNDGWPAVQRALLRAAAAKCCEMIGGAQQVLDMTVEYAKTRVQFGRPIGTFQAIQHHCANMAVDVETSRYMAYRAAWAVAVGVADAAREVSVAKAWVSDAYQRVCALAHQSHGAIGFTKEHNLQLYTRRAKAGELLYGEPELHRELVAVSLGL